MNPFEEYLIKILQNVDASAETKRELYEEFLDHLEQLRSSYVNDGVQDKNAIKLAIADFGESGLVGSLINKAVSPNRKWLQAVVWSVFTTYALVVVYQLLLSPSRLLQRQHRWEWALPPNLTPFRSILQYANGFQHYNFDIWFFNLFGNVLLFIPLGFLLPILFAKARRFSTTIVWSMLASLAIELTQFGARLGSFDVDDLILNVLGGAIGYAVWTMAAVGWRLTLQKLRPALE
ncbi:VanZ family protein [Paenibacillus harenae]|uniref:Glycopeptide antibiotics resistance protein n=1 Tax=Paenibacillus harenae TaxID=306543 RepID=A0ABT9U9E1_PAEHA|nr:VanZ family protein [Paenibacillus harenae]MDQ0115616.1 glycopeptide antibiotics resistance protein [Paenibacillus harenae]